MGCTSRTAEIQQLYFKSLPEDQASHSFTYGAPRHPKEKTPLVLQRSCFQGWNVDRDMTQLSLHHDRSVQHPLHCRPCTNPPSDLSLHFSLIHVQNTKILQFPHLGQDLFPNLEKELYPLPAQHHGLRFGGTGLHPGSFTLSCEPLQQKLLSMSVQILPVPESCINDHQSCIVLEMLVPISCFWSLAGLKT